ncbi:unnamed protein product [Agarophyton chilense]
MIRPTAFVYWNYLKGGVDEFSRAMTSLCYTNVGENPIVSIIGRLLCAQVNNAAVVHRLCLARQKGHLPMNYEGAGGRSFRQLRKNVAKCFSFADYARQIAKEYGKAAEAIARTPTAASSNGNAVVPILNFLTSVKEPMYRRDIAEKYNRDEDRKQRLGDRPLHQRVKGKDTYCSLCSYGHTIKKNGKKYRKKGGARQKQWYNI